MVICLLAAMILIIWKVSTVDEATYRAANTMRINIDVKNNQYAYVQEQQDASLY